MLVDEPEKTQNNSNFTEPRRRKVIVTSQLDIPSPVSTGVELEVKIYAENTPTFSLIGRFFCKYLGFYSVDKN